MRVFERLGGGDIGEDHELLDQPMRVEPLGPAHVLEPSLGIENKLALGQIEIERIAALALDLDDRMRGVERLEHGVDKRLRRLVRSTVDRRLGLLVRELGGGAHHDAVKLVRALAPVGAEDHAQGERGPVLVRAQRAEVVGDALRQHRHDAVGEIDRVAALERFPIHRHAGLNVSGDVGDRDGDDESARVLGIGIELGVDGVVVILGVGRIDGHERQRAPVLARRAQPNGPRVFGLFQRRGREDMGNMMRLERDEAHRALGLHRTYGLDDARGRQAQAALAQRLDGDEVAVLGFAGHAGRHDKFAARRASCRPEPRVPIRPPRCDRRRRCAPSSCPGS